MGAMKRAGANAAGDGFRGETCECLNRHSRYRPRSKCVCVCVNKMLDHYHQLRRQQTAALWRLMKVYIYTQIIEWTKQRLCQIDEDVFTNVRFCAHQKRTLAITVRMPKVF